MPDTASVKKRGTKHVGSQAGYTDREDAYLHWQNRNTVVENIKGFI